jgi:pyruvate kinase
MKSLPKRTKIVCTLGPASNELSTLVSLGHAGMDVARLNFSHGKYEWHSRVLSNIRKAGHQIGRPITVLQDLQGPKIRVGILPPEGVMLVAGKEVVFTTSATPKPGDITVTLPKLHQDAKRGARFLLDDGLLECVVRRVEGQRIHCEVIHGGKLTSSKGLNLPGTNLKIPALSNKDRADAAWGIKNGVDYIAMSFVRNAADVKDIRRILDRSEAGKKIKVIGKIEKPEALDNMDEILPLLDAVMVARGDLGIETPAASVPVVQKQLVARCRDAGIPAIVATQMLDSMQRNPRPTRAEVSDVANAVADHADAVMLSGETASGKFPLESVRIMADTIRAIEASMVDERPMWALNGSRGVPELIGSAVRMLSDALGKAPIVTLTASGRTAREVVSFRPEANVYAMTPDATVQRQMQLLWGAESFLIPKSRPSDHLKHAMSLLIKQKMIKKGTRVVVVSGIGKPGSANRIEIVTAS